MDGSWAQHMDIAITTTPLTPSTPPTAQNVNSIPIISCNFTVNLCPNRRLRKETSPRRVFLSRNIYAASSQHGPGIYQRASHKHFHCHTHTVTSALHSTPQLYRTNSQGHYRMGPPGSPSMVLNLPQTSEFCQTEAEEGQERPDKSKRQNHH